MAANNNFISEERGEKTMSRVYNFSAGPAVLPEEVLKEAAEEMLDYKGTGMSVMKCRQEITNVRKALNKA